VQIVRVGDVPAPEGYRSTTIADGEPAAVAAAIARFHAALAGRPSPAVIVASAQEPAYAMAAAGYAAKSGTPVLYVGRETIPGATFATIRAHGRPRIYVLGPPSVI